MAAGRSGTSRQEMVNQIGDVEGYEFISWLVPFITLRTTKSNISDSNVAQPLTLVPNDGEDEDENDFNSNNISLTTEIIINNDIINVQDNIPPGNDTIQEAGFSGSNNSSLVSPEVIKSNATSRRKWKKTKRDHQAAQKNDLTEEAELNFLRNADNLIRDINKNQDAQNHFANYIASSLRQLPPHLQYSCQNEISQVLFKYQANHYGEQVNESVMNG